MTEQWVNLPRDRRFLEHGALLEGNLSNEVRILLTAQQRARTLLLVSQQPDAGNATYSSGEYNRRGAWRGETFQNRRVMTNDRGEATIRSRVSLAGGDRFTITVRDQQGNRVAVDHPEQRRRLYYQCLATDGVQAVSASERRTFESHFWDPGTNTYLQLRELQPNNVGGAIPARVNVDDERNRAREKRLLIRDARPHYNTTRDPYGIALLFVQRNGISDGFRTRRIGHRQSWRFGTVDQVPARDTAEHLGADRVTGPPAQGWTRICFGRRSRDVIFDWVDPNVEWYRNIRYRIGSSGPWQNIPKAHCRRVGSSSIDIQPGYPTNVDVQLQANLHFLQIAGLGVSFGNDNIIFVATEDCVSRRRQQDSDIMETLLHELGHKIGMVPGQESHSRLDRQSTHYRGKGDYGPHCSFPIPQAQQPGNWRNWPATNTQPTCVMFGSAAPSVTDQFCTNCRVSLRKVDLRAASNGFRHGFVFRS